MNRRGFLSALAALPFMKWVKPAVAAPLTIAWAGGDWQWWTIETCSARNQHHWLHVKVDGSATYCCEIGRSLKRPTSIDVEFSEYREVRFDFKSISGKYLPTSKEDA